MFESWRAHHFASVSLLRREKEKARFPSLPRILLGDAPVVDFQELLPKHLPVGCARVRGDGRRR